MSPVETLSLRAADGYELFCRRWAPASGHPPCGLVVYLHGIQSHGGWYEASAQHFADAGLAVYLADRRGSGRNASDRGHADSWEQLARDVTDLEDRALADWLPLAGRLPLVLVGVSWGGKLAAALAAMHGTRYAGVVLLCPGICPRRDVSFATKAAIAWSLLRRHDRRLFPIPLNNPELFTANPERLDFLRHDALALHEATARFLFESRRLDRYLVEAAPRIVVPLLTALAEYDRIIDNGATVRFLERTASADRTVKCYGGAHHTLEFEPDPSAVFADVADWIVTRCEAHS
jgi:alpha-beta hydrolase superfamily lysophospholipase